MIIGAGDVGVGTDDEGDGTGSGEVGAGTGEGLKMGNRPDEELTDGEDAGARERRGYLVLAIFFGRRGSDEVVWGRENRGSRGKGGDGEELEGKEMKEEKKGR